MRKRISVCMLAAMMSVTSMYSFVAQGAENETEQETGIEQESETQAEEAVDPMSADRLLMRARDFRPSEILDAYFGEGKWDEALVTNQDSLISERNEYDGEDRTILISQSGVGFLAIIVTYKNEIPDEEIRRQEGEDLLQALNIDIMDEYTKQTDIAMVIEQYIPIICSRMESSYRQRAIRLEARVMEPNIMVSLRKSLWKIRDIRC